MDKKVLQNGLITSSCFVTTISVIIKKIFVHLSFCQNWFYNNSCDLHIYKSAAQFHDLCLCHRNTFFKEDIFGSVFSKFMVTVLPILFGVARIMTRAVERVGDVDGAAEGEDLDVDLLHIHFPIRLVDCPTQ